MAKAKKQTGESRQNRSFFIPKWMVERIKALAGKERRSMNKQLETILADWFAAHPQQE